ncbi:MAG: preprotein translocase subunit SecE [Bacilli bacterium]|nr:preprotein translocase subunit SecE [Bacilli bacterium]
MAKKEKKKMKKESYLKEVSQEMKKVTFPSAKEVVKYTFATICIVAFLIVFFLGLSALLSWIKEVM